MAKKYQLLSSSLFIKNRKKYIAKILPHSIAIFNSNDIFETGADSTLAFTQHSDIFYLTGIDQEESIFVLFPNAYKDEYKEMLFLREPNEHIAVWEGEKYSKEQAGEVSGIKNIYWLQDFDRIIYSIMAEAENVYLNLNEHYRASNEMQSRENRFVNTLMKKFPLHQYKRSNPILQRIRSVKEPEEIECIQMACNITEKGLRRILPFVKNGIWEYEIEAEFIHEFIKNRSLGFAYTPIIASGKNSIVLHYIENSNQCKDGEILLLDVGAEYANYSSDMTRTLPVNGRFTPRQKQVYREVLYVKNAAAKLLTVGNNWHKYHKEVGEIMTESLLKIGLLTTKEVKNQNKKMPAYKKYFMHGTSHHLGLDTHDYGILNDSFQANMVFTVEPGIYIPEEGFGIRIEDDYVIQSHKEPLNLMKNIPVEIEEIEALMNT